MPTFTLSLVLVTQIALPALSRPLNPCEGVSYYQRVDGRCIDLSRWSERAGQKNPSTKSASVTGGFAADGTVEIHDIEETDRGLEFEAVLWDGIKPRAITAVARCGDRSVTMISANGKKITGRDMGSDRDFYTISIDSAQLEAKAGREVCKEVKAQGY